MSLFRLNLKVVNETQQRTRFSLSIINLSAVTLNDWKLHFSITRFLESQSFTLGSCSQVGSFCTVTRLPNLKPADTMTTEFEMLTPPLQLQCDGILEAFVVSSEDEYSVEVMPLQLMQPTTKSPTIAPVKAATVAIIPKPNKLAVKPGHFQFSRGESLAITTEMAKDAALWLCEAQQTLHLNLSQMEDRIHFKQCDTLKAQAYQLDISTDKISIYANSKQGFSHGVATLLQLINDNNSAPCVEISDSPAYDYRGMMLDCARHFHQIEQVKLIIEQLARYKYNHFHWHLTDDEGWRIEIKGLPELTDIGAWRAIDLPLTAQFRHIQSKYGGFYTQQQITDVVNYAQRRGITVIPEIDIPGHCRAAIKSLPQLLLDSDDHSVYRSVQHYNDNVLSPALAGTYQFLDHVLEQVATLFPAPYVHIGADEVPEGVWTKSPRCQALMKKHHYADEKDLQGHLLRYVENKLHSLGKRMLGWEEAQHGGKVSQQTVIYSWQSEQAAIDCARQGFDVVLQPGQYTYLDMAQEFDETEPGFYWANITPLKHAYHYQPLQDIPPTDPIHKKVWGIQAGLWCELIDNEQKLQYMVHPRLQAIAEVCWTQADDKEWTDFLSRLKTDLQRLDRRGMTYRNPWH